MSWPKRKRKNTITQTELKEYLNYNANTGEFFVIKKTGPTSKVGTKIGRLTRQGYVRIHFLGCDYFAHRLAWLYMTGSFPPDQVDHIDCDKANNKFSNLRECTAQQNTWNQKGFGEGLKGTRKCSDREKWTSQIRVNNENMYLGVYDTELEAHEAYCKAAQEHFGEFMRKG